MGRLVALFALAALSATAAQAEWESYAFDNGAWFEARVGDAFVGVTLHCGGVSPQGLPLPHSDEPNLTKPFQINVLLHSPPLPDGTLHSGQLPGVMIGIGTQGYAMPGPDWNLLYEDHWVQPLDMGDGLIRALMGQSPMRVLLNGADIGTGTAPGAPLRTMIEYCATRWLARGAPVPQISADLVAALPAPTTPQRSAMEQAAIAHLQGACPQGVQSVAPGALMQGNIDDDDQPDIVLAWEAVTCAGVGLNLFCGMSQCLVDVFLSRSFADTGAPEGFYGLGPTIVTGASGRHVVRITGRLATCAQAADPNKCTFDWGWTGTQFGRVR